MKLPFRLIILLFTSLCFAACGKEPPPAQPATAQLAATFTPSPVPSPPIVAVSATLTATVVPAPQAADLPDAPLQPELYREPLTITRPIELIGYHKTLSNSAIITPVAHAIPLAICAPYYELTNTYNYDCAQKIEALQLAAGVPTVARQQNQLILTLASGTVETYTDTEGEGGGGWAFYSYINYLPEFNAYLLHIQYYEGSEFLLVQADNGAKLLLTSPPQLAPDGKHFFTLFHHFEQPLRLLLWRIDDTQIVPHLQLRFAPMPFFDGSIITDGWTDATTLQLMTTTQAQLPLGLVTISVNDDVITATYNGKPIVEPMLDSQQIRTDNWYAVFATEPTAAGQPIYSDRDYIFTEVPERLQHQPYFRFANYNMHDNTAAYVKFHLYQPATIYVAIDADACKLPAWLSDWSLSDMQLATSDVNLNLYQKQFSAGNVVLGGNAAPPASCIRSHYLLVVAQDDDKAK